MRLFACRLFLFGCFSRRRPTRPCTAGRRAAAALLTTSMLLAAGCTSQSPSEPNGSTPVAHSAQRVPVDAPLSDDALRTKLDEVILFTGERLMSPQVNNAWQVVHGLLAYGPTLTLNDNGQRVLALDYLLRGGQLNGWRFVPGEKGLEAPLDPGSKAGQGHEDQWLGYLSQVGVPAEAEIIVSGRTYQVQHLIDQAQWDVRDGMEATWTLMALSTYLPLDARWPAKDGTEWNMERLVALEAGQELSNAACGGSHRLYGLSVALNRFLNEGGQLTGGWQAADDKIRAAIDAAQRYQQPDGSFSINYFQRAASSPDIAERINATGHTLEFLAVSMTDEQIQSPWMARAANALCDMLIQTRDFELECGGLYHAAHGLQLYQLRRFGPVDEPPPAPTTAG